MASPQTENGYTKIANELYDAILKWKFSGYEYRILIFIIRKTYGWDKKEDWIALSQFQEATGIQISHICRTLNLLEKQNIITKGGSKYKPKYGVQKDYDKWVGLPKGARSHHKGGSAKGGNATRLKGVIEDPKRGQIQKKTITKETIQHTTAHAVGDINPIFSLFEKTINPTINYGNTTQRKAIETLINKVGLDKTIYAVQYAISIQSDRYAPTITTPVQLLNKYGELQAYFIKHKTQPKKSKHLSL